MNRLSAPCASFLIISLCCFVTLAGNLEPPGTPESTMATLEDIDAKLSSSSLFQFVGATSSTALGGAGWKGMNDLCISEFGTSFPSVRVCSSEEVLRTPGAEWPNLGVGPDAFYIQPTFQFAIGQKAVDISGLAREIENFTCDFWSNSTIDRAGLAVSNSGGLLFVQCNLPHGVTCCAPVNEVP